MILATMVDRDHTRKIQKKSIQVPPKLGMTSFFPIFTPIVVNCEMKF